MSAKEESKELVRYWTVKSRELLQVRGALPRDDLEYLMEKAAALRDERLQSCIAHLVGWGDDDRAEMETFVAIALEVMGQSTPSRLREAARRVELRYYMRAINADSDRE
jgi:hypothetical protein